MSYIDGGIKAIKLRLDLKYKKGDYSDGIVLY